MAFQPLADRIEKLPILLVGPLLRNVEAKGMAIWCVFKEPVQVSLQVFHEGKPLGAQATETMRFGPHFHVCCARFVCENTTRLEPGQCYTYDFEITRQDGSIVSREDACQPGLNLCIQGFERPSFVMPPEDLNLVRLTYGSCRKPHGEGQDMLPKLAQVLDEAGTRNLELRPQQLFLMGDQIYADDVAPPMLGIIVDAQKTLFESAEILPEINDAASGPGQRLALASRAGFTSSHGQSHLLRLSEFMTMYALVWSPTLWPESLPNAEETKTICGGMTRQCHKIYTPFKEKLEAFRSSLHEVQRTLANIPTYMIADDHEITDDWYLNRDWTHRVIANPLGRHLLTNGLCAYMVCQNWGNQPHYFASGPAHDILKLTQKRLARKETAGERAYTEQLCGLPKEGHLPLGLSRNPEDTVLLHFRVQAAAHEVWVLDTRTWRGFHERHEKDIPDLLSGGGWDQLHQGQRNASQLVIVVAPTNVIDLPATATVSKWIGRIFEPTHADYGDSWETQTEAFEHLLGNLTTNSYAKGNLRTLVILSGDVHYGFAARIHYRGHHPYRSPRPKGEIQAVMAHLTSSAFHNENKFTRLFHRWGYWPRLPWVWAWAGWHDKPQIGTSRFRGRIKAFLQKFRSRSLRTNPPLLNLANLPRDIVVSKRPDWRYRIDFLAGEHNPDSPLPKPKGKREGRDIVGVNNFGVIHFQWSEQENERCVLQELWWLDEHGKAAPRTLFKVSLGFEGDHAPAIPELPVMKATDSDD